MKTPNLNLLAVLMILSAAAPLYAQTSAGVPPSSSNTPINLPIPQKIVLPTGSSQAGVVTTDRDGYRPGQRVNISFVVSNPTKNAVPYDFPTGQQFDITVVDAKGNTVYDWAKGKLFSQNISRLDIAPGKQRAFSAVWNGRDMQGNPVPAGIYTINAHITSKQGTVVTGGVVVNADPDPTNIGTPTQTPADSGSVIQQTDNSSQVSATKQVAIGVPASQLEQKK